MTISKNTSIKTQTIHVHAFESVSVTMKYPRRIINAGSGGFDWYVDKAAPSASKAFKEGAYRRDEDKPENTADFLFEVAVPADMTPNDITALIDADLHDYCARAKVRRVGANVLEYWRRNKFKMGGAKRPSMKT